MLLTSVVHVDVVSPDIHVVAVVQAAIHVVATDPATRAPAVHKPPSADHGNSAIRVAAIQAAIHDAAIDICPHELPTPDYIPCVTPRTLPHAASVTIVARQASLSITPDLRL